LTSVVQKSHCLPRTHLAPVGNRDWDALWGDEYDAVTDLASPFALELIEAYPDAKVVLVQRDFDTSIKQPRFEYNINNSSDSYELLQYHH
jgi:hypothetical protein